MEIVPYTTSGNVKEMCKFHEHQKYGISVHLLGISEYLKCSFSSCIHHISSIYDDMDSSLLDVFADMIGETSKKKPTSPRSFAKDVVKCLAIVTPTSGRVDAAKSLSSSTNIHFHSPHNGLYPGSCSHGLPHPLHLW